MHPPFSTTGAYLVVSMMSIESFCLTWSTSVINGRFTTKKPIGAYDALRFVPVLSTYAVPALQTFVTYKFMP
jgi:hypothetical protein